MRIKRAGKLWEPARVAEYLGLSEKQVLNLMIEGKIPALQFEGEKKFRTTKSLVKFYLKQLKKQKKC